ncbi:tetratricopeptide repeat protein [Anaerosinus massiliensis]|uniref:tetratricopeptide repeat protein n=1 Tax=Massilibacillus massiliensis TaxID=1806837 RepID=UPI000DA63B56|nr:hypothetical protein [Massilibacillus massiliensis]
MDYIIITFLSIAIGLFGAFKIAKYIGLELNAKPLLLCVLCAILLISTLPMSRTYLNPYHDLVILGVTILLAYFIARYNSHLISHKATVQNLVLETAEAQTTLDNEIPMPKKAEIMKTFAPIKTKNVQTESMNLAKPLSAVKEPMPTKSEVGTNCDSFIEKTAMKLAKSQKMPTLKKQEPSESKPTLYLVSNEQKTTVISPPLITALNTEKTFVDTESPDVKNQKKISTMNQISKLEALDDLLDYAFDQVSKNEHDCALYAFKKALKLYQHDAYAPFIVIEIGNIYKTAGLYDDAIVIYNKALKLPALIQNEDLKREFINNIAYLRIIKNALLRRNITRKPFKDISQNMFGEIEREFQSWRTKNDLQIQNLGGL